METVFRRVLYVSEVILIFILGSGLTISIMDKHWVPFWISLFLLIVFYVVVWIINPLFTSRSRGSHIPVLVKLLIVNNKK